MSILGYSASYFLPEYWSSTPLYGEKIIPLLDYVLSSDYIHTEKLAEAFYAIEDKYTSTANLPINVIKEIIDESGYTYVLDLLGNDENSIRLLVYLLVLIHELKGTKEGVELVLGLVKRDIDKVVLGVLGDLEVDEDNKTAKGFSTSSYLTSTGFTVSEDAFNVLIKVKTGTFGVEQCLYSSPPYLVKLSLNALGNLSLSIGSYGSDKWNIAEDVISAEALEPNKEYLINLKYNKYSYIVEVAEDNETNIEFRDFIKVNNGTPVDVNASILYIGVDYSEGTLRTPFNGTFYIDRFVADTKNTEVVEWFDQFPVGDENTFIVRADLDAKKIGNKFFSSFSKFAKKYVYPTLLAFDARITYKSTLAILPHIKQRIRYICQVDAAERENFRVKENGYLLSTLDIPIEAEWIGKVQGRGLSIAISNTENFRGNKVYIYSEDGIDWKVGELEVTGNLKKIILGKGKFYVLVENMIQGVPKYQLFSSFNMEIWEEVDIDLPRELLKDFTYGNNYIAISNTPIIEDIEIVGYIGYKSNDAKHWEEIILPPTRWSCIIYGNSTYVALAQNSNKVAVSTNEGETWATYNLPESSAWQNIIYENGFFVAYSSTSVIYSQDGINWNLTNLPAGNWSDIGYNAGVFMLTSHNSDVVRVSEDLQHWVQLGLPMVKEWKLIMGGRRFALISDDIEGLSFEEGLNSWEDFNTRLTSTTEATDIFRVIQEDENSQI